MYSMDLKMKLVMYSLFSFPTPSKPLLILKPLGCAYFVIFAGRTLREKLRY